MYLLPAGIPGLAGLPLPGNRPPTVSQYFVYFLTCLFNFAAPRIMSYYNLLMR